MKRPFDGTLFRLPLRTEALATFSKISKQWCPVEMVRGMTIRLRAVAITAPAPDCGVKGEHQTTLPPMPPCMHGFEINLNSESGKRCSSHK